MKVCKLTLAPKYRWRVDDTHTVADYNNDKLFSTKGGSVVAVDADGDIISLCKNDGDLYFGSDILKVAVKNGGKKLDAYGDSLYEFYTKNGFRPISWTPFNKEYAPHDWGEDFGDNHHIIFYVYDPNYICTKTYEEFLQSVPCCKYNDGYEKARKIRDEYLLTMENNNG